MDSVQGQSSVICPTKSVRRTTVQRPYGSILDVSAEQNLAAVRVCLDFKARSTD